MREVVDVSSAARVMRAAHQAELLDWPDAVYLRKRYDAIFAELGAHEFISMRVEAGGFAWTTEPPSLMSHHPDSHAHWAWKFLPTLLDIKAGEDPFASFLEAPEFIIALFKQYAAEIAAAPENWLDCVHSMIEACLVAINPMLYFRTTSGDRIPQRPRVVSSAGDEFDE